MTIKQQDRPIVVTVNNRFVRGNGEEVPVLEETEIGEVKRFDTTPAMVRRGYGLTVNMGNFENARIHVEVEVPCYVQDLALADEYAAKFCENRIKKEVLSIREKDKVGSSAF
jgi:hypothetical protein